MRMKKTLFLFAASLAALTLHAQNPLEITDDGNTTREQWRDNVLRMDKNQVPTGFLLEYSMFGLQSDKNDGVGTDDVIKDDGRIFELHNILWHSKVNNNASIAETDALFASASAANVNNAAIPITCIYQHYNRIRQTALNDGLFTIAADDIGILDAPGRTTSPYDTYEIFAFAPFKTSVTGFNAITFTLPANLFYVQGISSIDIDFGDGAGYRTLTPGSTVNIYYATSGSKTITARLNTPNGVRQAQSVIKYKRPPVYYAPGLNWHIEVPAVYTDDNQYLGGASAARIMGNGVTPANVRVIKGCDNIFDRPIIFVEGFDPLGDVGFEDMIDRLDTAAGFMATMRNYGYDFVFVDFPDNTTYIENNAAALEAVINQVNQAKQGNFNSTMIGFSMGGLIARWCLRDMEDRGLQHHVENYFSYDAPHQGANIPLGMQYIFREMARDLPYLRFKASFKKLDDAFQSAAARQMLVTYGSYNNSPGNWTPNLYTLDPLRAAFAQRLQAKGYPQQTRNFGIAYGRGDAANVGQQFTPANPFGPQTSIFEGAMAFLVVNAQANANAVPENNTLATIAYYSFFGLTWRKIFGIPFPVVTLRSRRFDYRGQFPYDNAQGSYQQTQTQFVGSWVGGLSGPATTNSHDGHNFVATVSALDLTNQNYSTATNWQSNNMLFNVDNQITNRGQVNGNRLINPALSPFLAVLTATSDCPFVGGCTWSGYGNENDQWVWAPNPSAWHYDHNSDMAWQVSNFIERNILNATPLNCNGDNGLCNSNPTLAGTTNVCTSATFTIQNIPDGVTINWSSLYGGFVITNGQGTPTVTINRTGWGGDKVILTLTNNCGLSRNYEYDIFLGVPDVYSGSYYNNNQSAVSGDVYLTNEVYATLYLSPNKGFTSINWSRNPNSFPTFSISNQGPGVIGRFSMPTPSWESGIIDVAASHVCGTTFGSFYFIWTPGGGGDLLVSPNPANSSLTIQTKTSTAGVAAKAKQVETTSVKISRVEILNKTGNIVYQKNYSPGIPAASVNVSSLKSDVYTLRAFTGTEWLVKQIVVVH
jgi:pimeloyl-ACP methyl ester carboxylesterase